jgi:cytochrome c oxidase cbb3-type subunit 3
MANAPRTDDVSGIQTVGHEWDGIEELNNPLPRWWLWSFYGCILFAIGYVIVYPALPGLTGATPGTLGWSSRRDLAQEISSVAQTRAPIFAAIAATPIEQVPTRPELLNAAIEGGRAAFRVHCVQCHGGGANGGAGYPSLVDDDWLWGGDLASIEFTLTHGIRNPDVATTRSSLMPSFGRDGILTAPQISDVVAHVRNISRQGPANAAAARGSALFAANCAVCHGPTGAGNRTVGAPNLTDAIWLYGGSAANITQSVTVARAGVMPAWQQRLDPVTIRMLALYVHSLGGGEAAPAAAPAVASTPTAAPQPEAK